MPPKPRGRSGSTATGHICGNCPTAITSDCIQCGLCDAWLHEACAGITDAAAVESSSVFVFCRACVAVFEQFKTNRTVSSSLTEELVATNERVSGLDVKISELIMALAPILPAKKPSPDGTTAPSTNMSYASVASAHGSSPGRVVTISDIKEINAEEAHRRSGVIKGLPETDHGTELATVTKICQAIDKSVSIVKVFRMGIPRSDKKPRLMKVVFDSSHCLRSILAGSRRLKEMSEWKDIFIRRSMSGKERADLTKLYEERDRLNKAEQADTTKTKYIVLYEKIVRFVNCDRILEDGKVYLRNGVRDKEFKFPLTENPENS